MVGGSNADLLRSAGQSCQSSMRVGSRGDGMGGLYPQRRLQAVRKSKLSSTPRVGWRKHCGET